LIFACVLLAGCNIFSMAGILDNAPSSSGSGASSTLNLVPAAANILVSQQRRFTATGGAGGYSYSVEAGGVGGTIINSTGLYTAPAIPGTDTILVTDSAGDTCESTAMVTASVPLTITPATISLGAGGTVAFTASGGTLPYTYSVTAGTGTINPGTGFFTAPPIAESDTVRVTDGALNTAVASVTVTNPPALQISPTTATLNTGANCTFTASGGVPPYVFSVTSGTGTIVPATGLFTAPGIAEIDTVKVTDAGARTASATPVTIVLPGGPLTISPGPTSSVDAGQMLTFTASGGTPPYTFSVFAGGGSIIPVTGVYTAPLSAGTATVRVTDSASATSDSLVTINPPAPLQISPTSLYLVTGGQTAFSATGGIPPYSYSVLTGGAGGTVNSVSGLYTAPAVAGSDTVRVTDAASHTSDAPVTVYFPLTIVPTDATVQVNQTYSFDASGGVPGTGYVYSQVSGVGTTDPDGTYHSGGVPGAAVVKVVDSIGNSSTATVTVTAVGAWTIQAIDAASRSGQYASLALSGGVPQIAYYESQHKELRLEKWNGSAWTRQTVDSTGTVGQYASLALNAGANARISYYNATNRRLQFASWNGSSWIIQTVDSGGNLGKYTSLALDGSGNPRISYYDSGSTRLKYASWNGSSWTKQVVDSGADVGMYSSLALDAGGNPRISYYDNTNTRLKYASWNGSSWTKQVVDSGADVGMYSSLALDAGGNPRISYYDNTNHDLKYASWNGSAWIIQTVDSPGDVGMYSSLALDAGGNPHISYYDNTNKHLKYAYWSGFWNTQTVDPASNVGSYSSLRFDTTAGKARIAYYKSSSMDLMFAKEN
jgi:hypothetical protein